MRILWITHEPIRQSVLESGSSSGFWKEALYHLLQAEKDLKISLAYPGTGSSNPEKGVYTFRYRNSPLFTDLPAVTRGDLHAIIRQCRPDLVHVHGTEIPYGLLAASSEVPFVISLQGFISEWYPAILGDLPLPVLQRLRTWKERILRNGLTDMHRQWYHNAAAEIRCVQANRYFIGRTEFDHDFVRKHQPDATLFTGNELLREDFYQAQWQLANINRHSIYTSSFSNPVKGFHVLLEALPYLRKEFPGVRVLVPGSISPRSTSAITGTANNRIVDHLIRKHGLQDHIQFCGKLDGVQIARILEQTHVFVLPSFMENSSNALGEAMVTGTPVVSTHCGGTPSIVRHAQNGLVFRRGDAWDLAQKIGELFRDDEQAQQLATAGRSFGRRFHDPAEIRNQYKHIYQSIINRERTL